MELNADNRMYQALDRDDTLSSPERATAVEVLWDIIGRESKRRSVAFHNLYPTVADKKANQMGILAIVMRN